MTTESKIPKLLDADLHTKHSLVYKDPVFGSHSCDVCRNSMKTGFVCEPCNWDFCMSCYEKGLADGTVKPTVVIDTTNPPAEITVEAHTKHPLIFNPSVSGRSCDICRSTCVPRAYGCKPCGFDYCLGCYVKDTREGKAKPSGAAAAAAASPVATPSPTPAPTPVTPAPVASAPPVAAAAAATDAPPASINTTAHTKHPLIFNPSVTGRSCDICRGGCAPKAYGCKPCGFDFCMKCYEKGVADGTITGAGIAAPAPVAAATPTPTPVVAAPAPVATAAPTPVAPVSTPAPAPAKVEIKAPETLAAGTGGATPAQLTAITKAQTTNNALVAQIATQLVTFQWSPIDRSIATLKKSLADNTAEWQKTAEGSSYRESLAQDIYRLEQDIAAGKVEDEILKQIKALEASVKSLDNSKSIGDIPRNKEATQKLSDSKHGLLAGHSQGAAMLETVAKAQEAASARLHELQVADAVKTLNNGLESYIRGLNNAINDTRNPSISNIESYKKRIEDELAKRADLIAKFPACAAIAETTRKTVVDLEPAINKVKLTLEAEPIIRNAENEYRAISHEVSLSNRTAQPNKAWQAWIKGETQAKPLLERKEFHDVPKVMTFFDDRKKYQTKLDTDGAAVIFGIEMKKAADAVDWKRRQTKSDIDQEKPADGKSHREELRSLLPPFSDLYGRDPSGASTLADARRTLAEADTKLDDMEMEAAVKKSLNDGISQLMFTASYVKNEDWKQATEALKYTTSCVKEVNAAYPNHPKLIEFNKKLAKAQSMIPVDPELVKEQMASAKHHVLQDLRQCETAQTKRNPFLAREALQRLSKAIAPLQTGGRLATHADAAALLAQATPFLTSLAAIAEETVPEDTCNMVNAAITKLKDAISKRNAVAIVNARAIAMERINELKSQLAKATESSRQSSTEVLNTAEVELKAVLPMLPFIAEHECKEAETLVSATVALARVAISQNDARACIVYLQYLHSLVQPLAQIHSTHSATVKLVETLESITKELMSVKGVGDHDSKEVESLITDLMTEVKSADAVNKPVEALAALRSKKASSAALQLRQRFAFVQSAKEALIAADSLHITLQGRTIPGDPCWAPIVLTNWRSSPNEYEQQEIIATKLTNFNFRWSIANTEWASQKLDGTGFVYTKTTFEWLMDNLTKESNRESAIGSLNQVATAITALDTLVPGSPFVTFVRSVEASLRAAMKAKVESWTNIFKYVSYVSSARAMMQDSDDTRRGLEEPTNEYNHTVEQQSKRYGEMVRTLRDALEHIETGCEMVPDNCVDANDLSSVIRAKLLIAEDRFRQSCLAYCQFTLKQRAVENGEFRYVKESMTRLRTLFPKAEELKLMDEMFEARQKAIIEADAAKRAEYEAAKKAEADRVQKLLAQCEAKWVAPYSGGNVVIPGHGTYSYDARTGNITSSVSGETVWTFAIRKGAAMLDIEDRKLAWRNGFGVMKEDMSLTITTEVSNNTWAGHHFARMWQRYILNETEGTYASTVGDYHKIKITPTGMELVSGAQGNLPSDKITISGSVPPVVSLWCYVYRAYSKEWPNWIAARSEWNQLVQVEYDRRNEFYNLRGKGCARCGQTGNTYVMCYNCGYNTCGSKCNQQTFHSCKKCGESSDYYNCTPNRTWKQKTIAAIKRRFNDTYESEWRNLL